MDLSDTPDLEISPRPNSELALKKLVLGAFPSAPQDQVNKIVSFLFELGVESSNDMSLVDETMLKCDFLKPIQARKLIIYAKSQLDEASLKEMTDEHASGRRTSTPSPSSTLSSSSSFDATGTSTGALDPTMEITQVDQSTVYLRNESWVEKYKISLNIFNKKTQDKLKKNTKLDHKTLGVVVRAILDDALKVSSRPRRSDMRLIAEKFVKTFPNAVRDEIDGEQIGCGYSGLVDKLNGRLDNLSRQTENAMPRVKRAANSSKPTKKARLPITAVEINEKDLEEQKLLQEELVSLSLEAKPDDYLIKEKIKQCFHLQRKHLSEGMETSDFKEKWPLLFELSGATIHLEILTSKNFPDQFHKFFTLKSNMFCNFFARSKKESTKTILEDMKSSEKCESKESSVKPSLVAGVVSLLINHFTEDFTEKFPKFEPGTPQSEIEKKLSLHPCLVIIGDCMSNAHHFLLSVDGKIVNDHFEGAEIVNALSIFFGMFFLFNIEYPDKCSATLEFFQRCIVKINPKNGKDLVNSKVLNFINKVSEFDWMQ